MCLLMCQSSLPGGDFDLADFFICSDTPTVPLVLRCTAPCQSPNCWTLPPFQCIFKNEIAKGMSPICLLCEGCRFGSQLPDNSFFFPYFLTLLLLLLLLRTLLLFLLSPSSSDLSSLLFLLLRTLSSTNRRGGEPTDPVDEKDPDQVQAALGAWLDSTRKLMCDFGKMTDVREEKRKMRRIPPIPLAIMFGARSFHDGRWVFWSHWCRVT